MTDDRPDPDLLLARLQDEEARAQRGKLKIFFGASAGVGKTYAMLSAAHQQVLQGVDVAIGVVETHGRAETEALVVGMERLPLKDIHYRDRTLKEFDLDGALARKPTLILMDELAHSNVAGSRHHKRWQDVEELLAAGINVYSTVNVQHLESLNDVVSGITGIRVWETVPDKAFDAADEVVLVDLPPDELLQRLKEGKVYLPQQAERAIRNFFRKGNLIALRELALRRTADRVDEQMLQYRRDQFVSSVWQTRDSLLACIGPGMGAEKIVRTAARIAGRLETPWHVIYVETPELQRLSDSARHRILHSLKLAQDMGAQTAALSGRDVIDTTIKYARDHNLAKIIVGRDHPRPWRPFYRSFSDRIGHRAPDLDVIQVARNEAEVRRVHADEQVLRETFQTQWPTYAKAAVGCGLAGLIAAPLYSLIDLANIVMVFLLAVVLVGVRYGRGPAVFASFISVGIFDFFYVPPRFTFAVADVQYLVTFFIMLVVGLITGQLTAGFKYQAHVATRREQRVRALYEMSRDLGAALMPEQIAEIGERFLHTELNAKAAFILADDNDVLQPPLPSAQGSPVVDQGIAQWAFDHGEPAGQGTDTLAASPILYLPLRAPMRLRGVLALEQRDPDRLLIPEQRRLLDTFASLIAIALERVHYVEVARNTTVQMESERLRNSLLAAISHDLRTPLSVLVGLADALFLTKPGPTDAQAEIAHSLREEALRINAQVNNLLDMARLQAGRVELNLQWQPLDEVVGSALKAMDIPLAQHRVRVSLPDDLPLVNIDSVLLERVFCNLLENAAKYTPDGSMVDIGARATANRMEIWVEDNGPGLPQGREETMFKKFERGQSESATPGVGLGLTICRAIVQAHGGEIHAENRPQGGARFVFTLPKGEPPAIAGDEALDTGAAA
ncbi:MAG TPA: two-component system sensor histidine kinase KdpD [Rhodocyclaceae bacterium]|nr:two-component system sensor histidine kinase KdpD [Rhodocyclaceae bacterium]